MKKIAVIGSGISGLTSAYLLSQKHEVSVFEKNNYIGGHTATVEVEHGGQQHTIDTGFIVFNDKTYPNFLKLLSQIGVGKQESEMSFSVHNKQTGLEYNGHSLSTLFAQKRNLLNWKFWKLIKEILRFNKLCKQAYAENNYDISLTLGDFLAEHHFNDYFSTHYILPMGAAIWSSSLDEMQAFQFKFFVQFFNHHGLLNIADRPQWYAIPGGSKRYIEPLVASFKERIFLNSHIVSVIRLDDGVKITFADGGTQQFDEVVFACHSDQSLQLLGDATDDEKAILSAIPYRKNDVVLHTDTSLLPVRKKAWASWNYQLSADRAKPASVTYNMNILQQLKTPFTFCVTLNQNEDIDENKILQKYVYHHPVFNLKSMAAQSQRGLICGVNRTHFCGAYWYNGFHEDGVKSALDVGERFGCTL